MSDGTGSDVGAALGLVSFVLAVGGLSWLSGWLPGQLHRLMERRRQRAVQRVWEQRHEGWFHPHDE